MFVSLRCDTRGGLHSDNAKQLASLAAFTRNFPVREDAQLSGLSASPGRIARLFVADEAVLVIDVFVVEIFLRVDGDLDRFKNVCAALIDINDIGETSRCRLIDYEIFKEGGEQTLRRLQRPPPGTRCRWCARSIPWQLEEPAAPCGDQNDFIDERRFVDAPETTLTVQDVKRMLHTGAGTPFGVGSPREEGP
jgi:hypothetical protein